MKFHPSVLRPLRRAFLLVAASAASLAQAANPPVTTIATGLDAPIGMTFDSAGDLIVADLELNAVVKISRSGTMNVIGTVPGAYAPRFDASGNLYVSSRTEGKIVRLDAGGVVTDVVTGLTLPAGILFEPAGTFLVAQVGGTGVVRIDLTAGSITPLNLPIGYELAFDSAGRLLQSRYGVGTVMRYTLPDTTGTLIASGLTGVGGLAFDAAGALYITSADLGKIVRIPAGGSAGDYVTGLHSPRGLAFDSAGVLYVSNRDAGTIQRIGADTTAPVVSVPASVVVEATAATGATAAFSASALDDAPGVFAVTLSQDSGSNFPLGTTLVTATATDPAGNMGTASFPLIVQDTTAPVITSLAASVTRLWPANHGMVDIALTATATDVVGPVVTRVVSVESNEPDDGLGDGDTSGDVAITGPMSVQLRAERSGKGSGRVYTITVRATDAAGNSSARTVPVSVPRNASK